MPTGKSGETTIFPNGTTRVVGRADTIEAIQRELADSRLISIVGAGGIGKTTVALAVAEKMIAAMKDGVRLVDLAPLKDPSAGPERARGSDRPDGAFGQHARRTV